MPLIAARYIYGKLAGRTADNRVLFLQVLTNGVRWSGFCCPDHPTFGLDMTETTRDRWSFVLRPPETKPTSVSSRPDRPKPIKLSDQTTQDQTDEYLTY